MIFAKAVREGDPKRHERVSKARGAGGEERGSIWVEGRACAKIVRCSRGARTELCCEVPRNCREAGGRGVA